MLHRSQPIQISEAIPATQYINVFDVAVDQNVAHAVDCGDLLVSEHDPEAKLAWRVGPGRLEATDTVLVPTPTRVPSLSWLRSSAAGRGALTTSKRQLRVSTPCFRIASRSSWAPLCTRRQLSVTPSFSCGDKPGTAELATRRQTIGGLIPETATRVQRNYGNSCPTIPLRTHGGATELCQLVEKSRGDVTCYGK